MDIFAKFTTGFVNKVIDNADILVVYLDPAGNVSICNKKVEASCARSKNEILGKNWLEVLFSNDSSAASKRQMFKAIFDDSIKYKRANNFEHILIDNNNNERHVSWNITPINSDSGGTEGVLLIGSDITELKAAEASFKKIDETLKNIFSNIKEYALFVTNLDGKITYYGMGSEPMFGWEKNEIVFKHVSQLFKPEDAQGMLVVMLDQVKKAGEFETEIELVKKGAQVFPVVLSVSRFLDPTGELIGNIFIAKDITERKRLEYQVIQSEKLAAIGQLAAGMAHEINNPLFVISGRLEMLLEQRNLEQKLRETLVTINGQVGRIRKLVDQLLKFSRKSPPKLETLNLNEVIEAVLPLLSYHKLPVSTINVANDLEKNMPPIRGDLNQLQEVFINLFINAFQSMQEGGTLTISSKNVKNEYAQIKISDSGCGIAPENLKNIFMPFFSTKKEGTGLGLSICYNIIKNHAGTIDIESQLNKGTTFNIRLPFIKEEKDE